MGRATLAPYPLSKLFRWKQLSLQRGDFTSVDTMTWRLSYIVRAHAQSLSHVRLFATPRTITVQAPLSMGFPRQEYWNRLPCPPPGHLPNPGIEPMSLAPPAWVGGFFFFFKPLSHLGHPVLSWEHKLVQYFQNRISRYAKIWNTYALFLSNPLL